MNLDLLGETGLPGAQGQAPLTPAEIATLREDLAALPFEVDDALLDDFVQQAYELRGWERMRDDAEPSRREANLL